MACSEEEESNASSVVSSVYSSDAEDNSNEGQHTEGGYIDIPEHVTGGGSKKDSGLPEIPDCPGPEALEPDEILKRPTPTTYFTEKFPKLTRIYNTVVSKGVPNYRGARLQLESGVNIGEWEKSRSKFNDKTLVEMLKYGFPIGFTGKEAPATGMRNHTSARAHPVSVGAYVAKEVAYGALVGPMSEPPFEPWTRTSPLMTRPKADPLQRRVILDLSYPEG